MAEPPKTPAVTAIRQMMLSDKECALIEYCRQLKFGKFEVHVEHSQPTLIIQPRENVKL